MATSHLHHVLYTGQKNGAQVGEEICRCLREERVGRYLGYPGVSDSEKANEKLK